MNDDERSWDDDDAWDDDVDGDDGDDEPLVACPNCGAEILEDTPRCPVCEAYVSEEDGPASSKPAWVVATAVICLGMALWWIVSNVIAPRPG